MGKRKHLTTSFSIRFEVVFTLVHFMPHGSSFNYILNIFCLVKRSNLLRTKDRG